MIGTKRTYDIEWWRSTATHMWRTYFALIRDGVNPDDMSDANRKIWNVCDEIFRTKFITTDQDILRAYFTSRWGDDIYAVEDYSLRHDIPVKVIWMVIRRANRTAMEVTGLLDRKEGDGGG